MFVKNLLILVNGSWGSPTDIRSGEPIPSFHIEPNCVINYSLRIMDADGYSLVLYGRIPNARLIQCLVRKLNLTKESINKFGLLMVK